MDKIVKTTFLVTVLHENTTDVPNWSLESISSELDEGNIIGQVQHLGTLPVLPERLHDELLAVGNDGTFFGSERDEDLLAGFHIGRPVRLKSSRELFDCGVVIPAGLTGKIAAYGIASVAVTLDLYYPALKDYDNEIMWNMEEGDANGNAVLLRFFNDVELL